MSKNKKDLRTKKEEEKANRVIKIIFVSLAILGLFFIVAYSLLS